MGDLKNKKPQMIIQKTGCQGKMAFKWPWGWFSDLVQEL